MICELAWTLTRRYRRTSDSVTEVVQRMLDTQEFVVEHETEIRRALIHREADLADAVIHEVGQSSGSSRTITFDQGFAALDGVHLLRA